MTIELTRKPASATNGGEFDASLAQTVPVTTLLARNTSGITFKNVGTTTVGTISDTGAWTLGPTGFTGTHIANGAQVRIDDTSTVNGSSTLNLRALDGSSVARTGSITMDAASNSNQGLYFTAPVGKLWFYNGAVNSGQVTTTGAWTLGSATTDVTHSIKGQLVCGNEAGDNGRLALYCTNATDKSNILSFETGTSGDSLTRRWGLATGQGYTAISNLGADEFGFVQGTSTLVGKISAAGAWTFGASANTTGHVVEGNGSSFRPANDNNMNLGITGNRWAAVFAANGTIQTSDERLKKNIVDVEPMLDKILQLKPRKFESKYDSYNVGSAGFIAQELAEVFPDLVQTQAETIEGHEGIKTLSVSGAEMISYLVKAIQELKEINDALEARIATLEG